MLPSLVLCRRDAQPGAADWGYVMTYLAIKNATTPSHSSSVGLGVGSYGLVWRSDAVSELDEAEKYELRALLQARLQR